MTLSNLVVQVGSYQSGIVVAPTTVGIIDHTTSPVVVTATKINQSLSSQISLRVLDAAGNVTNCDPREIQVDRTTGVPTVSTFTGVDQVERYLQVSNAAPGLSNVRVTINSTVIELAGLKDNEVRNVDVGPAWAPGTGNVVVVEPLSKPGGGGAWVLLADRPVPKAAAP
jgi:hypothetical protein